MFSQLRVGFYLAAALLLVYREPERFRFTLEALRSEHEMGLDSNAKRCSSCITLIALRKYCVPIYIYQNCYFHILFKINRCLCTFWNDRWTVTHQDIEKKTSLHTVQVRPKSPMSKDDSWSQIQHHDRYSHTAFASIYKTCPFLQKPPSINSIGRPIRIALTEIFYIFTRTSFNVLTHNLPSSLSINKTLHFKRPLQRQNVLSSLSQYRYIVRPRLSPSESLL